MLQPTGVNNILNPIVEAFEFFGEYVKYATVIA